MRHIVLEIYFFYRKLDLMSASRLWLWIIFVILVMVGCKQTPNNQINIESYYFPIHNLDGGMMFVYKYKNATMPEFYWHLQTQKQQDSLYLNIVELREDFSVQQKLTEQILPSGSKVVNYQIMDMDSTGQVDTATLDIESGVSYPFYVEDNGGVYIFQAKWFFPKNPEFKYTLVRNRRYGGPTTFRFKGKEIPAIKMNVKELIVTESDGWQELEFNKTEIYAKGLGLVFSKSILNDSLSLEYQLEDTLAGSLLLSPEYSN